MQVFVKLRKPVTLLPHDIQKRHKVIKLKWLLKIVKKQHGKLNS